MALKAAFEVTLVIPSELTAVSNMPIVSESGADGSKTIVFAESPIMSTYLLAFVIGDLSYIEQTGDNGTLMRVFTTRGREEQGRFALDVSLKLLQYFNDYFGIPYPLPKMDHIAIPDFAAGAMENWGAITYRETALLVDPDNGRVDHHVCVIGVCQQRLEDAIPDPGPGPAREPLVCALPVPVFGRHVLPVGPVLFPDRTGPVADRIRRLRLRHFAHPRIAFLPSYALPRAVLRVLRGSAFLPIVPMISHEVRVHSVLV